MRSTCFLRFVTGFLFASCSWLANAQEPITIPNVQIDQSNKSILDALRSLGAITPDSDLKSINQVIEQYRIRQYHPNSQNPLGGDGSDSSDKYAVDVCFINPDLPVCPCAYAPDSAECKLTRGES